MRGAMRQALRTALLTAVGILVIIVIQQPLTLPSAYSTIWLYGGLAAAGVAMAPRPWVGPVLVGVMLSSAWGAWAVGYSWWIVALRAIADLTAVAIAGLALRRHTSPPGTLGRDWIWSALALIGAAALRTAILWPTARSTETAYSAEPAILGSLAIGTLLGLALGQVIGACIRDPRSVATTRRQLRILLALAAATAAFLVATAVLPEQVDRYASPVILDAPIVILAAFMLSYAATSLLAALLVLGQAALLAQGLGVYRDLTAASEITGYQLSLLFSLLLMLMFAAAIQGREERQRAVETAERLSTATFDRSPIPTVRVAGGQDVVIAANDALAALAWRPLGDIVGRPLATALMPERGDFREAHADGGYTELLVADRVGNRSWIRVSRSRVDEASGMDVLVLVDITAERMSEELMRRQSRTDALTGLPNRVSALDQLTAMLDQARPGCGVGVLTVDIDRLRRVNDALGRAAGDAVIETVGRILVRATHGRGLVGRTGEDEFLIALPDVLEPGEVEAVAAAVRGFLDRPLVIEGAELTVSVTIGGGVIEAPGTGEAALRLAGAALARAKQAARGTALVLAGADTGELSPDALAIERELRAAIAGDRLVVHYQPIVDAVTHGIRGAEALVRLPREDGSLLDPGAFLPIAAELGLLGQLTWRVLTMAVHDAVAWQPAGPEDGPAVVVSVNAPPRWLAGTDPDRILGLLATAGLDPSALSLEVTEDELVEEGVDGIHARMQALRAAGVRIAMDDFGTGYAGLEAFRSLPVDVVKIDQSFVAPLAYRSPDDEALVTSVIRLIHRFERVAVAEGVETADQAAVLAELGCDLLQGYRFGRPVTAEAFADRLSGSTAPMPIAQPEDPGWQRAHQ